MFWKIVFLLAIVFVLTYNPSSRTLERFIGQDMSPSTQKSCEPSHFEAVQFAQTPYDCPKSGRSKMGVIT